MPDRPQDESTRARALGPGAPRHDAPIRDPGLAAPAPHHASPSADSAEAQASILEAVCFAAQRFLGSPSSEEAMAEAFRRLGQVMRVHRADLYEVRRPPGGRSIVVWRHGWMDPEHEWTRSREIPEFHVPAGFEPLVQRLRSGAIFGYPQDQAPPAVLASLEQYHMESVLILPIHLDGTFWGMLILADCERRREWSAVEVDTLRVAGSILGALVHRERMEDALREAEAKYRGLVEGSKQPIVIMDADGFYRYANNRAAADLGMPAGDIVGKSMYDIFPRDYAEAQMQILSAAIAGGELFVTERKSFVNGQERWYEARIQPFPGPDGKIDRAVLFMSDISDRKQAEARILEYQERLRSLTSELALTEQRERRRIAGEIHDRIGQALAISKMKLGALCESAGRSPIGTGIQEVRGLLEMIIQDTRSLTFELSPPVLYEIGLEPALEWLVERFQGQHGIRATFSDDGNPKPLGEDLRGVLFQSVQEALLNVVKHAHALRVQVLLRRENGTVIVEVIDDGVGFDPTVYTAPGPRLHGFGLFSIRERLAHLGGSVMIDTTLGKGTRVVLRAPLGSVEREDWIE